MRPAIFIVSSVEGKDVANAIQLGLQHDARPAVWHQSFPLSQNTIDTLLRNFNKNDFAVFVFSPDDVALLRNQQYDIARDNVLFEAGLFIGMHGKERTFLVTPQGSPSFHIPTDLLGLTTATYDPTWTTTEPNAALGPAVTKILQTIQSSSWLQMRIDIVTKSGSEPSGATYPLKLRLTISNNQNAAVAIETRSFAFDSGVPPAPNAQMMGGNMYKVKFLIGRDFSGKDVYVPACIVEPGTSITAWVPIDPSFGAPALDAKIKSKATGTWQYRCVWLTDPPITQKYEEKV